jgi:hypothetical protein
MSSIGSTSAAGLGFAGSIVGSSQPEAATDRGKAASAEQKARIDQRDVLSETLDDVADPEFGSDRDADGRLLYRRPDQTAGDIDDAPAAGGETNGPRTTDAFGNSGKSLDLDA